MPRSPWPLTHGLLGRGLAWPPTRPARTECSCGLGVDVGSLWVMNEASGWVGSVGSRGTTRSLLGRKGRRPPAWDSPEPPSSSALPSVLRSLARVWLQCPAFLGSPLARPSVASPPASPGGPRSPPLQQCGAAEAQDWLSEGPLCGPHPLTGSRKQAERVLLELNSRKSLHSHTGVGRHEPGPSGRAGAAGGLGAAAAH